MSWINLSHHDKLDRLHSDVEMLRHDILMIERVLAFIISKCRTTTIEVQFSGDIMPNSVVLNVGQTSQASIVPLAADGVTNSGGTVSNAVYTFSDPSATVVGNPDGTATVTGVAASSGAISGSVSATVTDTDGAVSQWNQAFTVTVNAAVPPAQLTQSVQVNFTTPQ